MTCQDCATAAVRMHHGFSSACRGCQARSVSRSQEYQQAREWGGMTDEYRAALETAGLRHSEVTAARKADAMSQETKEG